MIRTYETSYQPPVTRIQFKYIARVSEQRLWTKRYKHNWL